MAKVVNMDKARATKAELNAIRNKLERAFGCRPPKSQLTSLAHYGRATEPTQRLTRSDPSKIHHAKESMRPGFSRELIADDDFGWSYVIEAVSDLPTPHNQLVRHLYMPWSPTREAYSRDVKRWLYNNVKPLKGDSARDVLGWMIWMALEFAHRPAVFDSMEPWKELQVQMREGGKREMTKSEWDKNYAPRWNEIRRLINTTDRQALEMLRPALKPRHAGDSEGCENLSETH